MRSGIRGLLAGLLALITGCAGMGADRTPSVPFATCHPARCVSSLDSGPAHVAPVQHELGTVGARARLHCVLSRMPRTRIVIDRADYLHATVRTRWMGFVDDLEFAIHQHRIDLRAAARAGYHDFGVNRDHVTQLREALQHPCP